MPTGGFSKQNERAQNAGLYKTRIFVYQPRRSVDAAGSVIRQPGGVGAIAGSASPPGTMLWDDRAMVLPFGGSDRADAGREVSAVFCTVEVRWGSTKPYRPGMIVYIPGTGETWQIDAAEIIGTSFKKHQLVCRMVS